MIVEFVGCTGAGKTTLLAAVRRQLAQVADVQTSFEAIATPLHLQHTTNRTTRNLIQEAAVLPIFLRTLYWHRELITFVLRMLARQSQFTFSTFNILRSLERKLGVHETIGRNNQDQILLVDEGTILLAHNIFVYTNATYTDQEISQFVNLIPLPDVVIYIRAPQNELFERTLNRKDPPREMRSANEAQIKKYIDQAVTLFEFLAKDNAIRRRLLVVENPGTKNEGLNPAVDTITQFLLSYEPIANPARGRNATSASLAR